MCVYFPVHANPKCELKLTVPLIHGRKSGILISAPNTNIHSNRTCQHRAVVAHRRQYINRQPPRKRSQKITITMDLTRCLLLGVLVLGLLHSGLAKPSAKPAAASVEDEEYPSSDDNYEYDEETGNDSADAGTDRSAEKSSTNMESNNVLAPPYFKQANYTTTVKLGDTAMLECKPLNLGPTSLILWYSGNNLLFNSKNRLSDDQRMTVDDQSTLRIVDVTAADQGDYRCEVFPSKTKQHVQLDVQTKPSVSILQANGNDISEQTVELHQGESFEMECKGSGRPEPTIKWSSNGQRVLSGNGIHVDGAFLSIKHADHEHVRRFQCLAENSMGVVHVGMSISVRYAPKVGSHRRIVNTIVGDSAELHCDYNSSIETRIEWRKDDHPIEKHNADKYRLHSERRPSDGHHRATLQVRNVQPADLGAYECDVRNTIGEGRSRVQLVLVPEPPHFVSVEKNEATVVTHWAIRSHQPLSEVTLSYVKDGSTKWLSDQPVHHEKSKEHSGVWKIQHKLSLSTGVWHARVKARNIEGWSEYSEQTSITVEPIIDNYGSQQFTEDITENRSSSAARSDCSQLFGLLAMSAILLPIFRRV